MRLSIIIPVYKVEKYIRDTLQSIYRQQYDENLFEVIVINDGTPDDSMRIVAEFTNKHANLHIINQKNQGLSCARNAGLKIAQGEYVWFVDSDDTVTEESIGKVIECIERSKADVIGFSILKVSEANRVSEVESAIWNEHCRFSSNQIVCDKSILFSLHTGAAVRYVYRRAFLQMNHLRFYPGILYEDQEFLPRVFSLANSFYISSFISYRYLLRSSGSIMSQFSLRSLRDTLTIVRSYETWLQEEIKGKSALINAYINGCIFNHTYWLLSFKAVTFRDEQKEFMRDHYVEIPFDLSQVFWIVTANTVETIPPALLDRMEVVQLSSYTEDEKVKIAELHLLPKERQNNGLTAKTLSITEDALRMIIRGYTREAGVRNLERKIAAVCRKTALRIVNGEAKSAKVTAKNLHKYLGKVIYLEDDVSLEAAAGICTGLAWTRVGGELLKVEVVACKGKGHLALTGQLGDVMKESAQAGYTYIRSRADELGLDKDFYETTDIHIHLPEGAIPKDGPSAGITMATAMISALTGRKVKKNLAMTGEITLSGRVLPVGGIKEKFLAAHRYGVKTIIMPAKNEQDLEELPANVRAKMHFIPVKHMDEVLKIALED